jgi:DNA-binding winged helix-turn-helix (wHTH) protein
MLLGFADCELDEKLYQLRRSGKVVKIEPKVFDVLLFLLRNRERVVSKTLLLDTIWPGESVSESVLPRCIAAARRAIGDDRTRQALIQTVHGRGYRFIGEVSSPERPAAAPAQEPADEEGAAPSLFVGRDAPMEKLRAALDQALRARGRLALLVGEPGIGKTRTAEELAEVARARGARVLLGRCYEGEGAPAYWPWVQVLRSCVADGEREALSQDVGPGLADLARLVPELRADFPDLPPSEPIEGEQARFRLFDSVSRYLERLSLRQPLAIGIDDLHWADADSLLLLQFLAGSLRNRKVLLLATYRDVEVRREHPLGGLLGALAREPHCERVVLRGLTGDEVAALVEAIAGEAPSQEMAASIHDMTEGNPFFVHEIVLLLSEQGRLSQGDARELALALPQSVRDAVGRRLDSLSPECNELLRVAAVLGREFGTAVLERALAATGDGLLEPIAEALDAKILVESDSGISRYAFAHALTRHTLYEELSVPQRVQLHRRVAQALEAAGGESPDALLSELAHHYFESAPGGDVEKAVGYSVRAAERAHGLFAYDESTRHYERALEALELKLPVDEARRCELVLALAEELWAAGSRARSRAQFIRAADIARQLGAIELLARAAAGLRGYGEMGVAPEPETLALLEEALVAVGEDHAASRSRVLSRLAGSAPYSRKMAERRRLSGEAYHLAVASGDRLAISDAIAARYWATLGPDHIEERKKIGEEALVRGHEWGDPRLRILGYEAFIGAHLVEGEMAAAGRDIDRHAELAREMRQPLFLFLSNLFRGSHALNLGRFDEAENFFDDALAIGRGTVAYAEILHAGTVHWLQSMRGEAPPFAVDPLLDIYTEEDVNVRTLIRVGLAMARLAAGDTEAARREYEAIAQRGFRELERDESWLLGLGVLADLALESEDAEGATVLYELLAPYEGLTLAHDLIRVFGGTVSSALGVAATAVGELDQGEIHLERAMAREAEQGLLPALCNSQGALARLLVARRRRGDLARARSLIEQAEAGAAAIGTRRGYRQAQAAARALKEKGA